MTQGPDDIPVPRLREGWEAGPPRPDALAGPQPELARLDRQRRALTLALLVFLVAAIALLLGGARSLALPALGVATGWAIRLCLLQRKADRLQGRGA